MIPHENKGVLTFPTLYENYFWKVHAWLNIQKQEARGLMLLNENSKVLTFPTFYENYSWIIRAWLNPLDLIFLFSYFKWKLYQPVGM